MASSCFTCVPWRCWHSPHMGGKAVHFMQRAQSMGSGIWQKTLWFCTFLNVWVSKNANWVTGKDWVKMRYLLGHVGTQSAIKKEQEIDKRYWCFPSPCNNLFQAHSSEQAGSRFLPTSQPDRQTSDCGHLGFPAEQLPVLVEHLPHDAATRPDVHSRRVLAVLHHQLRGPVPPAAKELRWQGHCNTLLGKAQKWG